METKSDQYQALLKMPCRVPGPNKQNNFTSRASLYHFHPTGHIIDLKAIKQLLDCFTNYTRVECGKLHIQQRG